MISYVVCRTCGRHVNATEAVNRGWCSEECIRTYATCETCGRYFPQGAGADATHCSPECMVRYQIRRRYGPEPVTVVSEV